MKWRIPVEWSLRSYAEIEAPTLEMAIDAADNLDRLPNPDSAEYIDGSYQVPDYFDSDEIRRECNNDHEDEPTDSFFKFKKDDLVVFNNELWRIWDLCVHESGPCYWIKKAETGERYFWPQEEAKLSKYTPAFSSNAGIQELFD